MSTKTINIVYWILTGLFALAMLGDAYGGLSRQQAGQDVLKHLGYPMYALTIFGLAKLLGVIAILQTKYVAIKEWAYAGFVCTCIGAFMSRSFVGDGIADLIAPLILLAFTMLTYYFWKKRLSAQATA